MPEPSPSFTPSDFDQFYTATAKRLVAAVYAATGDLTEAEDAVQEAYARARQRWDWPPPLSVDCVAEPE